MRRISLRPTDVLRREPAAQIAVLADGRLLVRHPAGVSVLSGFAAEEVRRVLEHVDGERTVEALCRELAAEKGAGEVARLLSHLVGDLVHLEPRTAGTSGEVVERPGDGPGAAVRIVGGGAAAERLARELAAIGVAPRSDDGPPPTAGESAERFGGDDLVIGALEDVSYRTLFGIQRAAIEAGAPSLFVTLDPDGLRIGPTVVPGLTPCLACAQGAGLRFLGLPAADVVAAVEQLRTRRIRHAAERETMARTVAREVGEILHHGGRPQLLGSVVLLPPAGKPRRYRVQRLVGCPLCARSGAPAERRGVRAAFARRARHQRLEVEERAPRRAVRTSDDDGLVRTVGILGGGTAGYLAALALRRKRPELEVTLIASSRLPVIGVGEATTPLLPQFLHADLGLDVGELFRRVRPTLKLGIRFEWGGGDGHFNYPFGPVHPLEPAVYDGDVKRASLRSMVMSADVVPLERREGGGFRSHLDTETAYHLDNRRFVRYLEGKAGERGIPRIDAVIADVELAGDGRGVEALVADDGRRFAFDLYVDCSGFRSLLLERSLGSPFVGYESSLPTDRAIVASAPRAGRLLPYTVAETMDAGWCWNTPQRDADHRGYVYCSAYLGAEEAEAEMRRKIPGLGEARRIAFRAGRHRHFWRGNVVALGNAYGFVEPLESTALHLLIRQIGLLVRAFPLRRGERGIAAVVNRRVAAFWDYVRWFLALHFRFNRRLDTPFWRFCRREVDVSGHGELLSAFRDRGPLSYDPVLAAFEYPDPLWGAEGVDLLLLGQQVPTRLPRPGRSRGEWRQWLGLCQAAVARAIPQAEALAALDREGELLDRFGRAFRDVGPAFPVAGT